MKLIKHLKKKYIPLVKLAIESKKVQLATYFKKPIIHFEEAYYGEKILILALYEKGYLRADIIKLLNVAKEAGAYIIAVNTQKLASPNDLHKLIDLYIERPNFGQDFGSYKLAFQHIYKHAWDKQCPRLLMLNDSVFYSQKHLKPFIHEMFSNTQEVLSATENYEHTHHLGSFCISINHTILKNNKLIQYWKNYKNTNVRTKVIEKGEKKLTKTLRKCTTTGETLSAYYDVSWFLKYIQQHPEILLTITDYYSDENFLGWKLPSLKSALHHFEKKYIFKKTKGYEIDSLYFTSSPKTMAQVLYETTQTSDLGEVQRRFNEEILRDLIASFTVGSQIHQNAILLHHLGCPLIKLDLIYRGVLTYPNAEKICQQLEDCQKDDFRRLLYSRPYGLVSLHGWRRRAFENGSL